MVAAEGSVLAKLEAFEAQNPNVDTRDLAAKLRPDLTEEEAEWLLLDALEARLWAIRRVKAPEVEAHALNRKPHPAKAVIVMRGLTQRQVAEAVGVNEGTFSRILNGHVAPWPRLRQRLAEYLQVAADDLFRDEVSA